MRGKVIKYKGETHNIKEWARILKLTRDTISRRLANGESLADIENHRDKRVGADRSSNRLFEYGGQMHTLKEWAKITGLSKEYLRSTTSKGYPLSHILDNPNRYKLRNKVKCEAESVKDCFTCPFADCIRDARSSFKDEHEFINAVMTAGTTETDGEGYYNL